MQKENLHFTDCRTKLKNNHSKIISLKFLQDYGLFKLEDNLWKKEHNFSQHFLSRNFVNLQTKMIVSHQTLLLLWSKER
jgi:hypothetical protein